MLLLLGPTDARSVAAVVVLALPLRLIRRRRLGGEVEGPLAEERVNGGQRAERRGRRREGRQQRRGSHDRRGRQTRNSWWSRLRTLVIEK